MDEERWAVIPSFPAYSASTHGRIKRHAIINGGGGSVRIPSGCLTQRALPTGHRQVTISMDNKPRTLLVHRLVAEAFLERPAEKEFVCHRDDDPTNNHISNLYWGDRHDNTQDMMRLDGQCKGAEVASAKLTDDAVRLIRARVEAGERQHKVAADFGISQSNVSFIVKRQTWGHVA